MFCPNCGKDIGEAKFCPECGAKIQSSGVSVSINERKPKSAKIKIAILSSFVLLFAITAVFLVNSKRNSLFDIKLGMTYDEVEKQFSKSNPYDIKRENDLSDLTERQLYRMSGYVSNFCGIKNLTACEVFSFEQTIDAKGYLKYISIYIYPNNVDNDKIEKTIVKQIYKEFGESNITVENCGEEDGREYIYEDEDKRFNFYGPVKKQIWDETGRYYKYVYEFAIDFHER